MESYYGVNAREVYKRRNCLMIELPLLLSKVACRTIPIYQHVETKYIKQTITLVPSHATRQRGKRCGNIQTHQS